jgi:Hypervirulence associated proteins TUDOR domain
VGMSIRVGTTVTWHRGTDVVEGTVRAIHPRPVVRRVNGVRVARVGTPEDPAYEIEQSDGSLVLRLHSEIARR